MCRIFATMCNARRKSLFLSAELLPTASLYSAAREIIFPNPKSSAVDGRVIPAWATNSPLNRRLLF
jgi:hypothetical protein